jgi:diadenylate cyclase
MILNFFITIHFFDILDIFLVSFLFYQFYKLLKDSVAVHIFVGFFALYLIWLLVKALNMQMLSLILGQFMGVGVVALLVVFQPELRRFFLMLGSKYFSQLSLLHFEDFIRHRHSKDQDTEEDEIIVEIMKALRVLSKKKIGALIVYSKHLPLMTYAETGVIMDAVVHHETLISIFFKNNPLHDGAVIIHKNKILAAKVVLPLLNEVEVEERFGMRHRSALSMNIETNVPVIIVSEETGGVSVAIDKKIVEIDKLLDLREILKKS